MGCCCSRRRRGSTPLHRTKKDHKQPKYGIVNSRSSTFPRTLKILLLGNRGVGKSSLVWRLTKNLYHPEQRPSTEVSITAKSMKALPGLFVHADLWDVPGTEAIDMGDILFQEVDLAVLVCSLDDKESLRSLRDWHDKVRTKSEAKAAGAGPVVVVLGNKMDAAEEEGKMVVTRRQVVEKGASLGADMVQFASASSTDTSVLHAFREFLRLVVQRLRESGGDEEGGKKERKRKKELQEEGREQEKGMGEEEGREEEEEEEEEAPAFSGVAPGAL